jgi:hypothetical protein
VRGSLSVSGLGRKAMGDEKAFRTASAGYQAGQNPAGLWDPLPGGRRWSLLVQQPSLEPGALDHAANGRRRSGDAERDTGFLGGSAGDQQGSQS